MKTLKSLKIYEKEYDALKVSYDYDELSDEAKKKAIKNVKEAMYEGDYGADSIADWAADDDYLFEPLHQELLIAFGPHYQEDLGDDPMIANTRKGISYVAKDDQNYYLHCSDALNVTNEGMFLGWLKFPPYFWDSVAYTFRDEGTYTKIEFEIEDEDELTPEEDNEINDCIPVAEEMFESHMSRVLDRITETIEAEYEDEQIIERISAYDITFDIDGEPLDPKRVSRDEEDEF